MKRKSPSSVVVWKASGKTCGGFNRKVQIQETSDLSVTVNYKHWNMCRAERQETNKIIHFNWSYMVTLKTM